MKVLAAILKRGCLFLSCKLSPNLLSRPSSAVILRMRITLYSLPTLQHLPQGVTRGPQIPAVTHLINCNATSLLKPLMLHLRCQLQAMLVREPFLSADVTGSLILSSPVRQYIFFLTFVSNITGWLGHSWFNIFLQCHLPGHHTA